MHVHFGRVVEYRSLPTTLLSCGVRRPEPVRRVNHMEIHAVEPFLAYFESIRSRTRRVIACIPPEQLEWRSRPGAFSFGDLVRHIAATERYMFAENVQGRPSRYPGHGPELAAGYEEVMRYFEQLHTEPIDIFRSLSPEGLTRKCVPPLAGLR